MNGNLCSLALYNYFLKRDLEERWKQSRTWNEVWLGVGLLLIEGNRSFSVIFRAEEKWLCSERRYEGRAGRGILYQVAYSFW